jgi:predicted permease
MLAATPGFTAIAILSLAIGIGANTSTFSLVDALLLRPPAVPHPDDFIRVVSTSKAAHFGGISYPDYLDFRGQTKTLSGLAAYEQIRVGLNPDPQSPAQLQLALTVTTNFFDVLGVKPSLGRAFTPDEDRQPVVVLSDFLWESQFARDPSILGRTIRLSKAEFKVIGIAPKSFPGLDRFAHESMYLPLGAATLLSADAKDRLPDRGRLPLDVFGRLATGSTPAQTQAELQSVARNLERAYPDTNRGRSILAMREIPMRFASEPEDALQESILLALASCILLIACANVASLLLSRARARSREIAIRLAIGASRRRLFQQLLTESLLLALAGGAVGLLLALFSIDFFASIRLPTSIPIWVVAQLDHRVLIFTFLASLLSGVIFGIAPAWHTLQCDLNNTLKSGGASVSGKRRRFEMRNVLVVGQIAISMTLLLTAGLLVKDFGALARTRTGFRTDHVLVAALDPGVVRYTEPQARAFYRQVVDRIQALPGVRSVSLGLHVPLGFSSTIRNVKIDGYELSRDQQGINVQTNIVDDRYFPLMQIPIVSGRMFTSRDTSASPLVAIVNETMAQKYWPKRNPIGGRFRMKDQTLEVVGVAKTIKYRDIGEQPQPFLYLPFSQQYISYMTLHVESVGDPAALAAPVLAEIRRLDPGTPVQDTQTLDHFYRDAALFGSRLIMQIVAIIGLLGLLLASTGLYGVIAYSVSRRTREIGIRMAIGANPEGVARLVIRQAMNLTLLGGALGLAVALSVSKLLSTLLVGVSPRDPFVFAIVAAIVAAVSLLASYVPARRAARVDPLVALRHD